MHWFRIILPALQRGKPPPAGFATSTWADRPANVHAAERCVRLSAQKYRLRWDEIEDVQQEVFLACCRSDHLDWSIDWSCDQRRFIRRVAERRCVDHRYRDQYRRRRRPLDAPHSRRTEEGAMSPTVDGDPCVALERHDLRARVAAAVDALPAHYREVVKRKFWEAQSTADIAAAFGVPVETVRTRLKRALKRLERELPDPFAHDEHPLKLNLSRKAKTEHRKKRQPACRIRLGQHTRD